MPLPEKALIEQGHAKEGYARSSNDAERDSKIGYGLYVKYVLWLLSAQVDGTGALLHQSNNDTIL